MTTVSLYDAIAQSSLGRRQLAKSRLRYRILSVLQEGLGKAGISQNELASRAEVSKSAVSQALAGNGNLRADTIATYLDAMGFELHVDLAIAGTARADATNWVAGPVLQGQLQRHPDVVPAIDPPNWGEVITFELSSSTKVPAHAGLDR